MKKLKNKNMKEIIRKKISNYYLIEDQKQKKSIILEGYPCWLTIDPTNFCDLHCPLCPTGQRRGTRQKKTMSYDIFKRIIDMLGTYLIHIDFCNWGEPLLNESIFDMISYARGFSIHTKLDTNFNIFSEEKAEKLINSGLDKIILSIDGATKESYQKYRRGGDINRVIENIKMLVKMRKELKKDNPVIEWQFLVFRHNEHEIEEAKKIAGELGVDKINFTPPYTGSLEWLTNLEPFRSKYYEVTKNKVEFKKSHRDMICNWLWDAVTVNSDGSISPCCSVEDAKDDFLSCLPDKSFSSVWNSEKYKEARQHVLNSKDKIIKDAANICLRCDHIGWSNHMDIEHLVRKMEKDIKSDR